MARVSKFPVFGDYSPPKAERLLDAFSKAGIQFEIECDDGATSEPSRMGWFGERSKMRVFVATSHFTRAKKIHLDLFGDAA